jgi:hypothetical protein
VMNPHIASNMDGEIVLPKAAREGVADHDHRRTGTASLDEVATLLELRFESIKPRCEGR